MTLNLKESIIPPLLFLSIPSWPKIASVIFDLMVSLWARRSTPAPTKNPPRSPPGTIPVTPNMVPNAPDLASDGTLFLIILAALEGIIPPVILPLESSSPKSFLVISSEFFNIWTPAPIANPPRSPNPEPVIAPPTIAPMVPDAIVWGKDDFTVLRASLPISLPSLTAELPKRVSSPLLSFDKTSWAISEL